MLTDRPAWNIHSGQVDFFSGKICLLPAKLDRACLLNDDLLWIVLCHGGFSVPTPCVGEATGEDAEDLAGVGRGQYLDAGDPFDPFKAATAWGD